ncbi:ABC transporter substrate-binding protein [Granulosicoccus sp. 3-233]|uniref:ABC transporter substrate-binding protein n=1 Tax=Granulosicoccus sp. 3-233 TaxID=3417969 RepID=UPI003D32F1B9
MRWFKQELTRLPWLSSCLFVCVASAFAPLHAAQQDPLPVPILYIARDLPEPIPLSLLDEPAEDNGVSGARLGLNDNKTTGGFLGHDYSMESLIVAEDDDIVAQVKPFIEQGRTLLVADLQADDLLALADAYAESLLFNVRARDTRLRDQDCRANLLHVAPSRAMLADALIQYLSWKRWDELVLVTGRHPEDQLFADALSHSVTRFGLDIVEDKRWTAIPGARRSDSGHHSVQQEIPVFSRFSDHDVVLLADELDEFGEYFSYHMTDPRPVAGTQGLVPTAWDRTQEQWGATQIQRRFEKLANRFMTPRDYSAWAAMRAIAEGVTKTGSADVNDLRSYLLSNDFKLAGFKGVPLSFRTWNGQLRQPVLLAAPRMLVSVSPQEGFLHQVSELDTLGVDEPESSCTQFQRSVEE